MVAVLPSDPTFREAFANATVSKPQLAKYYLRTLELHHDVKNGELVVASDPSNVNLEHVLPQKPSAPWDHVPSASYASLVKRIGNFALLNSRMNSRAANAGFATKKGFFAQSQIALTRAIADHETWSEHEIDARQAALADLAVRAWPLRAVARAGG